MKAYKRSQKYYIIILLAALASFANAVLNFSMQETSRAVLWLFITLLWVLNAYMQKGPYILMDDEKLIIKYGLRNKEYFMANLELVEEKLTKLILADKAENQEKRFKIYLGYLDQQDRHAFIDDLKYKLSQ